MTGERVYSMVGPEAYKAPDYGRVVRQLSDDELRSDLAAGRGDDGYRDAARRELERRAERDA